MDSFDESTWDDLLDCSFIDVASSSDFRWVNQGSASSSINFDFSQNASEPLDHDAEKKCTSKRGRNSSSKPGSKACRERMRREKLNESFLDLSTMLEPGRTAKTDRLAILADTIRVLNQLRCENEDFKEENKKLQEEIRTLKLEKHELREEKQTLKAEKDKMEVQMKAMSSGPAPGFMSPHPPVYHPAGMNKVALVPSYGVYPMWHYLPSSVSDTSHDHELRPPAA